MRLGRAGAINAVNKKHREERQAASELQERKPERPTSGNNIYMRTSSGRPLPLHHERANNDQVATDKIQPSMTPNSDVDPSDVGPQSQFERTVVNEVRDEEFANEAINLKKSTAEQLIFRKYPWSCWLGGLFFLLVAGYLFYHLALGPKYGTLIKVGTK